jgi:hypothetical protein
MSSALEDLALRKEALVAQAAVERTRLRYEIIALRSRAISVPVLRGPAFALLLLVAGRLRFARWIAKAARLVLFLRLARNVLGLVRGK